MGRKRTEAVPLPEGVQVVRKKSGRVYYYYQPHRNTDRAGARVRLPDPSEPEFWLAYRKASTGSEVTAGSFDALIRAYKASPEWQWLRPKSRENYEHYLKRLSEHAGDRMVSAMTKADIYALRDGMSATPHAANMMVTILRLLIEWSIPKEYRADNPAIGVKRLKIEDDGAKPWDEASYAHVLGNAEPHIRRMVFLGRATGQRVSDLVRMRPADMEADGINVWVGKRREKKHFVPLTKEQVAEINSWGCRDLERFIRTKTGKAYGAHYLSSGFAAWRDAEKALEGKDLTVHGLRATAVYDRHLAGATPLNISDEICMSVAMVSRYLRFANKKAAARQSRDQRARRENEFGNRVNSN